MRSVLVTGSDGFVGRHLVRLLVDKSYEVSGFDLAEGFDVRNYEQIRLAVERCNPDLIFHLAGQAFVPESTTDARRGIEVNTLGTLNLLEAVRHTGCRARVHLAGTSAEYGYQAGADITEDTLATPDTPYGVSKLAATYLGLNYANLYKMNVVATRAFNHTGPGHSSVYAIPSFAKKVAEVEAGLRTHVEHGDLSAMRNYTDVRDVVKAYLAVIYQDSGIYNVCSTNTVSMQTVLDGILKLSKTEIPIQTDPGLYRLGYQTGPAKLPIPNCDKLTNATGWRAEIPLEYTLQDTLNYWREKVR